MIRDRGTNKGLLAGILVAAIFLFVYVLQALFSAAAFPLARGQAGSDFQPSYPRPDDLDPYGDGWLLTAEKSKDPYQDLLSIFNPELYKKELQGVMGASVDRAWNITMGRPQVLMAELGTGIRWQSREDMEELARKFRLNQGETTPPLGSDKYDKNGDGVFNVDDYAGDPRVSDLNGNGVIDPEDVIWAFSDGKDNDGNGYKDDICGWDFLEDDNDPWDEVDDGAGTEQCRLMAAEANNQRGTPGACPNGTILPVRIGYSGLVDMNDFAQGVLFAVDSGAWVIEDGLETFDNTSFGQQAIDYAWSRGVAVVTAAGDEASASLSFPGGCERTIQVSSVTKSFASGKTSLEQSPDSYLYPGASSNYGNGTLFACPSDGRASTAAATSAGIAGLLYSAAEDKIARGEMWRYPGLKTPLSAGELKQLLTMTSDGVDMSGTDSGSSMGELDQLIGPSQTVPSTAGWDPCFGYGRVNAGRAVEAVAAGRIPPEAEIESPGRFDLINPGQVSLDVTGRVAAVRAASFQYTVQYAPGMDPGPEQWISAYTGEESSEAVNGVLASLDLAKIYAAIQASGQKPEAGTGRYAFTLRLRVRDDAGNWGEDRKVLYCFDDPQAASGTPYRLSCSIAAPRLADLDGDGVNEVIAATGDGLLHAYRPDFSELPGWPVHTDPLALHDGSAAFTTQELGRAHYAAMSGSPAIGDLDHDGRLDVVAGDAEGRLYAWASSGDPVQGFPVRSNPLYSIPERNDWWTDGALRPEWNAAKIVPDRFHRLDKWNRLDRGFLSDPVLCNLDNSRDGSLEIIASAMDDHVYAWHADGKAVTGWPVKLADPAEVSEFNQVTQTYKVKQPEKARPRSLVPTTPSAGDINGDGFPEVVCLSDEFYLEDMNVSSASSGLASYLDGLNALSGGLLDRGNARAYAVSAQGTACSSQSSAPAVPGLGSNAFLPGWPVSLAAVDSRLCRGGGPAAIGDVDGDRSVEIGIAAFAGPPYLLNGDGSSHLGNGQDGLPLCLQAQRPDRSRDGFDSAVLSNGAGGCFVNAEGKSLYVESTIGIGKLIDLALPGGQSGVRGEVAAWNVSDGQLLKGFPSDVDETMSAPAIGDVNGDNNQEMVIVSGTGLHALDLAAKEALQPRFVSGPAAANAVVGDGDGDGSLEVLAGSVNGWLLIWKTSSKRAEASAAWPEPGRDPRGTSCIEQDGMAPARVIDLQVEAADDGAGVKLAWTAPGDDGRQGQAMCYDIRYLDRPIDDSSWAEAVPLEGKPLPAIAGTWEEFLLRDFWANAGEGKAICFFALQCRDEAGNISPVSNCVSITR